MKAVETSNDYIFDREPQMNAERYQMIMKTKPSMRYLELTEKEIDVFRSKAEPLHQKYLEMGGKGARRVLDAVLKD